MGKELEDLSEEDTDIDLEDDFEEEEQTPDSETGREPDDEEVTISKSKLAELEKAAQEREQLSGAVKRLNQERGRSLPGVEDPEEQQPLKRDGFVTVQELERRDEQQAIAIACENPEISDNWHDIIANYVPPKNASFESKLKAIREAHAQWKSKQSAPKPVDPHKKAAGDLSSDSSISKGKEKDPAPQKKHILKKDEKMTDWYK